VPFGPALVRWTGRGDGDLGLAAGGERRAVVWPGRWAWLRQVHGATVRLVSAAPVEAAVGDALVTRTPQVALAVISADCAPVVLASSDGVVAVAHGGWRGLAEGVLRATVTAMRAHGADGPIDAVLGPCIRPCCYEFGVADLERMAARFGPSVVAATTDGRAALDLPAVVRGELARMDVTLEEHGACTSCDAGWYSHRARGDVERQASLVTLA
jgi:YfiH family protein